MVIAEAGETMAGGRVLKAFRFCSAPEDVLVEMGGGRFAVVLGLPLYVLLNDTEINRVILR